jgi:hypothetical protein
MLREVKMTPERLTEERAATVRIRERVAEMTASADQT